MSVPKNISISDYTYQLPDEKIALHPKAERDASKLLVYKNNNIVTESYKNIAAWLPEKAMLVFNDTKVIRARLRFQKSTGGGIEIFCLEPYEPISEYSSIMNKKESVRWKCMIGGVSKWKEDKLVKQLAIGHMHCVLEATLVERLTDAYVVEFSWQPADTSFAEILEAAGDIPLPPYIKRVTDNADTQRYQTIYAKDEGSVAAPTAGLHFTPAIFESLAAKAITTRFVTLHVGAGTFKPVKAATMAAHEMHAEWIDVSLTLIEELAENLLHPVVAVGTTSLRTLESLYWMGLKTKLDPAVKKVDISQWEVYEVPLMDSAIAAADALRALATWMKANNLQRLFTQTQILIAPGYRFKIAKAIVTNFHQPQSTLLLLVAAAIGQSWKTVYNYALENDFRFLSYGDGSLLFIDQA